MPTNRRGRNRKELARSSLGGLITYSSGIKDTGVLSELEALKVYIERGWDVFTPVTVDSRADFIAVHRANGMVRKVQVKTVQDNKVGGVTYRQCRLMPHNKPYDRWEVDTFVFIYPPSGEVWLAGYDDIEGQTSLNFGRADGKGRRPKNTDRLTKIERGK